MDVDVRIPTEIYPGATTNIRVASCDLFDHGNTPYDFKIVPCITMNKSLEDNDIPREFELLVIDVNGGEPDVLKGINLTIWKPKMVIVATHKGHDTWDFNAKEINRRLAPWYREVFHDHINSIYIRRKLK